uniref:Pectinesterase inhibitor domain-containing protein n=1 Tax=Kalanchoe fedtschenkoi TaxID=63787 RepID=A0A7N0UBY9_KALFE
MEEFGFCHNFFYSHMDPEKDLVQLMVGVTAEAALANATDGLSWIRASLPNDTDPDTKNSLTECENAYDLLVKAFTAADASYKKADYSDVVFQEKGTPRAQMSCQMIWGTLENLMTERNRIMRMLTAMAVVSANYVNQCLTRSCPS